MLCLKKLSREYSTYPTRQTMKLKGFFITKIRDANHCLKDGTLLNEGVVIGQGGGTLGRICQNKGVIIRWDWGTKSLKK